MSNCPYCGSGSSQTAIGAPRRPTHQLRQCLDCSAYHVRTPNGKSFPLHDRNDPNADAVSKVVDG